MIKYLPHYHLAFINSSNRWLIVHNREREWSRYCEIYRQFEQCLEYGKALSEKITGRQAPDNNAAYGFQIFIKILSHCICILKISPDPTKKTPFELWDVSSSSAISRCVIDAYDSLMYITAHEQSPEEKNFRMTWFDAHELNRRIQMLNLINAQHPELEAIKEKMTGKINELKSFSQYFQIDKTTQGNVISGKIPSYHLGPKNRFTEYGVEYSFQQVSTIRLSQYVHTHPFSIVDLFDFQGGSAKSALSMSMPQQHALPFLCRSIIEIQKIFPNWIPKPPSRTAATMLNWFELSATGSGWDKPFSPQDEFH